MKFLLAILALAFTLALAQPLHAQSNSDTSPIQPEVQSKLDSLNPEKILYFKYSFGVNGGSSAAAINLGSKWLPGGARIIRNYFYVVTPMSSAVAAPVVAFACGSANLFTGSSTTAISNNSGNGGGAGTFVEGVATGASTVFSASVGTAPCRPAVTITVQPATAGDIRGYIKYIVPTVGSLR